MEIKPLVFIHFFAKLKVHNDLNYIWKWKFREKLDVWMQS